MKILVFLGCVCLISTSFSAGDDISAKELAKIMSDLTGIRLDESGLKEIFSNQEKVRFYNEKVYSMSTQPNPKVNTTSGEVEGTTGDQAHAFYEIPYAEPPTGDLRYQPPQPLQTPRIINATRNGGLRCHQVEDDCSVPTSPLCQLVPMDEDCLVLNVFSPLNVELTESFSTPSQRLPVFVFIHGGRFKSGRGTSEELDGSELAAVTNMVVVTINYRLGAFGFLVHKEEGYPDLEGNQGFKDQQMALQWVQDNIANFGGDKTKVTIAGSDAGAQSVMFHTLSSTSKPLYRRAIQQSNFAGFIYRTKEDSVQTTTNLLRALKCNETIMTERECLLTAEATTVSGYQLSVSIREVLTGDPIGFVEPYRPILDGVEFSGNPLHMYRDGKWNSDKEMIVGVATQELDPLFYILPPELGYSFPFFVLDNYFLFGLNITDQIVERYIEEYPPVEGEEWGYEITLAKELTHCYVVCSSRALARHASATTTGSANIYFYANQHQVLNERCMSKINKSEECYYATHGSDVPYVFRTGSAATPEEQAIEDMLSTYWGSFARSGAPSNNLETAVGNFTDWPIYTNEVAGNAGAITLDRKPLNIITKRLHRLYQDKELGAREILPDIPWEHILIKAPNSEVIHDFDEDICDFWDSLGYYMDPIPLPTTTLKPAATEKTTTTIQSTTSGSESSLTSTHMLLVAALAVSAMYRNVF